MKGVKAAQTGDHLDNDINFLAGGGEMGALIRSNDWSKTPLGPIETWSPALRMMVRFLLANRFPAAALVGAGVHLDLQRRLPPDARHEAPLGAGPAGQRVLERRSGTSCKPLIDTPFNGGPATWIEDILLEINRHGFVEETHFTIAYSPVPDETAPRGIGGVLATVHEITEKVVGERRVAVAARPRRPRGARPRPPRRPARIAAETLGSATARTFRSRCST